jgi:hypothetical protein
LHFDLSSYEKPLAAFLNRFSEHHRDASDKTIGDFKRVLSHAINGVDTVFGDLAFKIFTKGPAHQILSEFNAALFDAEMIAISRAPADVSKITQTNRSRMIGGLVELFQNEEFQKSVTLATSDVAQIKTRIKLMQDLVNKYL